MLGNHSAADPTASKLKRPHGRPAGVPNPYQEPKRKLSPLVYACRKARYARRMTAGEVAFRIGYDIRTIESWERGATLPGPFALQAWADAVGVEFFARDKETGAEI